ncbi:VanZ family protein [Loigolactobacillus backii]|uniref:Uncharacterized protein n=1 Tax=Loigolactobacillus backii TaxID=375175 RepID=A0A192H1S4_9LACO|nr:VanZ family protein [Loigolactobacillus backii]ANK60330.1 hypothetical protein AYR52_08760 [Loigolactobacillus backii]ANK62228.1 hypothetical protein AYR53_05240 [Loigolactobacillus backii]ANK65211.1 hypothetical protein AYR54_08165 [Loigolactobacillus backii]ANK67769.1 hypothetical protein AYR55_08770 [Loigolactobacillus backii]ANK70757.1 hypothetical protein AYR56_11745 [Loigolactobacillus backii]
MRLIFQWLPLVLAVVAGFYISPKILSGKKTVGQKITLLALVIYLISLVALCLVPAFYSVSTHQASYIIVGRAIVIYRPFQDLDLEYWLNAAMTLPLGILLTLIYRLNWRQLIMIGFLTSLFIETSQFILDQLVNLQRTADIDDLITNTVGVVIGGLVVYGLKKTRLRRFVSWFSFSE